MSRIDHFTGQSLLEAHPKARLPYDFDFRKKGTDVWRYMNSVDDPKKFQALLENHVQQNDRSYILDFLANLPEVQMYISEHCIPDKEPPA